MKYVISANHVKLFAKSIHCLARLGNEIYMDFLADSLDVKTVNESRSVFAWFAFQDVFFEKFEPVANGDELPSCKVPVKTILQVFRSMSFIERSVETCELELSENCCQLVITLNCKHAVIKTYRLNFEECDCLKAVFTKDICPNKLAAPCKLLQDVLINFPSSLDEISITVTPCKVMLSNYTERTENVPVMSTVMNLNPEEFSYFQIGVDTSVSFCLKDFRAIMNFGESCNAECRMDFEDGGKPFALGLSENGVFKANFMLATVSSESETLSTNLQQTTRHLNQRSKNTTAAEKSVAAKHNRFSRKDRNVEVTKITSPPSEQFSPEIADQSHHPIDFASQHTKVSDLFFCDPVSSQQSGKRILAPDSDDES